MKLQSIRICWLKRNPKLNAFSVQSFELAFIQIIWKDALKNVAAFLNIHVDELISKAKDAQHMNGKMIFERVKFYWLNASLGNWHHSFAHIHTCTLYKRPRTFLKVCGDFFDSNLMLARTTWIVLAHSISYVWILNHKNDDGNIEMAMYWWWCGPRRKYLSTAASVIIIIIMAEPKMMHELVINEMPHNEGKSR